MYGLTMMDKWVLVWQWRPARILKLAPGKQRSIVTCVWWVLVIVNLGSGSLWRSYETLELEGTALVINSSLHSHGNRATTIWALL